MNKSSEPNAVTMDPRNIGRAPKLESIGDAGLASPIFSQKAKTSAFFKSQ